MCVVNCKRTTWVRLVLGQLCNQVDITGSETFFGSISELGALCTRKVDSGVGQRKEKMLNKNLRSILYYVVGVSAICLMIELSKREPTKKLEDVDSEDLIDYYYPTGITEYEPPSSEHSCSVSKCYFVSPLMFLLERTFQ